MGEMITLAASDGHELGAYLCEPEGAARGGVVIIQEIFGVNEHIRDVAERYAAVGYKTIAPALYDRFERDFQCCYSADEIATGREFKTMANDAFNNVMLDVEAARKSVLDAGGVGVTGYCWGGVVTWGAACRLHFQAASSYYGAGILPMVDEKPRCPTILHFGNQDASIPMSEVDQIAEAHPDCEIFVYDADHGFNCDRRGQFDPRAMNIAAMRTIRLFDANLD